MLRPVVIAFGFVLAVWSLPADILPEPGHLALILGEEEFEDYLDMWLAEQQKSLPRNASRQATDSGCSIRVNGDLAEPQPVYLRKGKYLEATGTSGEIHLRSGEKIYVACTGSRRTISHPQQSTKVQTATATCERGTSISGKGWLKKSGDIADLTCSSHSSSEAEATSERCYGDNLVIRVGYVVDGEFYPLYWSCFDQNRLEVLYVQYELNPANAVHMTTVKRPGWLTSFFPGVGINKLYTQSQQRINVAKIIGKELAHKYIDNKQYLARGHLAAKTDYVFATGQRSTFYFINCAPQWQPFNAGNWNYLEQNSRKRIGAAGYNTIVYSGTFGVTQLRDENDQLVDIYLSSDENNNQQVPVPQYYYKVIYEPSLRLGTAFVAINNPYYTEEEVRELTFCTDRCRNNPDFDWVGWDMDRIEIGYSFCCDIDDFRQTVPHLPEFEVDGLLS